MKADQIKKLILEKKTHLAKPVEEVEILGIKGWLFRSSSFEMEGWREACNHKDDNVRKLGSAKLIQISFRDEDGIKVFDNLDLPIIGGIDDSEINRVFKRALAINGYGGEGIEAILKNLVAICGIDGVYASLVNINAPCPNCSKDIAPTSLENSGSLNNTGQAAAQLKSGKPASPVKSQAST